MMVPTSQKPQQLKVVEDPSPKKPEYKEPTTMDECWAFIRKYCVATKKLLQDADLWKLKLKDENSRADKVTQEYSVELDTTLTKSMADGILKNYIIQLWRTWHALTVEKEEEPGEPKGESKS